MDRSVVTKFAVYREGVSAVQLNYNGVLYINKGTVTATVNGFPLDPGQSIGWQHNQDEVNRGNYDIGFPNGVAGAQLWGIYIYYTDSKSSGS